jgi:hypothetical protein
VAGDLRADIERVTGVRPGAALAREAVLVGTIGRSALIDGLVAAGKLDVSGIRGSCGTVGNVTPDSTGTAASPSPRTAPSGSRTHP